MAQPPHGPQGYGQPTPPGPGQQNAPGQWQQAPPGHGQQSPPAHGQQSPPAYGQQQAPPGYGQQQSPPGYGQQQSPPGYGQQAGPGYGQQPQPGQQPQQPVGQSQLIVNLRKPFGLLADQMVSPIVRINGHQATARWGQNFYPTHAGHHQIDCSSNYMWQFGPGSMTLDIPPGQSVEVHYTGPVVTFGSGRMGYEVQPRPGMVAWIVIISIPVALILLLIVVGIVSAIAG
ncbi:hypothetical protein [Microlunatus speluncae]|uniref:hypothetical protein n=1 Tax=Microlunatus speluncae TaxID=2594267 RepID=UPI001478597B|nr:hypothetical protein [Microlunatus speluncae]